MLTECGSRTSELEKQMAIRERAEQQLRSADQRKDEFVATLAHELRNPLAAMSSAMALIERPTISAAARTKTHGILDRQLRHMARLIDDLLDVSRIATGKVSADMSPLNIGDLLRSAVELAEPQFIQNGLRLRLHLPDPSRQVNGDAGILRPKIRPNMTAPPLPCRRFRRGPKLRIRRAAWPLK